MDTMGQLTDIYHSVFSDEAIELADRLTADDIESWDSIAHINLIFAVEEAFGVTFSTNDLKTLAPVGDHCRSTRGASECSNRWLGIG